MSTVAFWVIAFMLTAYVLLDGFDLGIAAIGPLVARNERERKATMEAIGPFWNGNEVWLIAGAGGLFALFPAAYASAFSGFYLPFIVLLWLLMFRGIAIELRDHFESPLWHQFWDAAFCAASVLLIAIFGIAFGNLLRGLPLDASGYFQGTFAYLLNPYALFVGIFALAVLGLHGAAFAAMRIDGDLGARAQRLSATLLWIVGALYVGVSGATFAVRGVPAGFAAVALPIVSVAALAAFFVLARRGNAGSAFVASSAFVVALLVTGAWTLYPYLLPAVPGHAGGITIFDAAPSPGALACALAVTIGGSIAVLIYGSFLWWRMGGKVHVE